MLEIKRKALITGHKGSIFTLLSDGPDHIISGAGEGWVVRWNLKNPDPGKLIAKVESNIFSLMSMDQTIIAGDMNGGMHWVNMKTKQTISLQHHRKGVFAIFKADNNIYALGGDGYISRRSLEDPRKVDSVQISALSLRSYSKINDSQVAIGASDGAIYRFDLSKMEVISTIKEAHDSSVFSLVYDKERRLLWSGGRDAQIKVWASTGVLIKTIPAHMYTINSLMLNDTGTLVFSASRDKTIKVWDAESFELLKVLEGIRDEGHLNSVNCLLWCPEYQYLISGSDDKRIGFWSVKN